MDVVSVCDASSACDRPDHQHGHGSFPGPRWPAGLHQQTGGNTALCEIISGDDAGSDGVMINIKNSTSSDDFIDQRGYPVLCVIVYKGEQ